MFAKQESSQMVNLFRMINHPRLHELTRVLELPTQTVAQKEIVPVSQAIITEIGVTALA
jgi:hypothetical protein